MKILIIDDSEFFRGLIKKYLVKEIPEVEIVEYKVEELGKPGKNFIWSDYDVLLLDYNLGNDEDGLAWLEEFGSLLVFPPTIVLTGAGDEYVAVNAIKLGAVDYINKNDISKRRLAEIVCKAAQYTDKTEINQKQNIEIATQTIIKIRDEDHKPSDKLVVGYKFIRMIGEGGMSKIYLAEREEDNKSIVLKILELEKVQDMDLIRRFTREAELVADLDSPHIVSIYEHGFSNEFGFIAMEFFTRGDLQQRLKDKITLEQTQIYIYHIALGLQAIHEIGVVHRDLKPSNIMFRSDDSLVIGDFGISKQFDSNTALTEVNSVIGTPHYMSPEQGEGKPVDIRTDIYSAGVIFFELLSGKRPYRGSSAASLIYKHVHADIPKLPDDLIQYQEIIERVLAKNPDDRYQSATEFIKALEAV
jgi:DNA-binding NarL/FixJ family response regulator